MILAGGEGKRLAPLTNERAKPAVPFGGRFRIIDIVLSNFANSGVLRMKVLTQYKSDSLNTHLSRGWRLSSMMGQFVEAVPAQQRTGPEWYRGSADAIYQNLNLVTDEAPEYVFVFGADHIYRMDTRQMLAFHTANKADCTVAAIPIPIAEASAFGCITVDWQRPDDRLPGEAAEPGPDCPAAPPTCSRRWENYLFTTESLVQEIVRDAGSESAHDFGRSIMTEMYKRAKVCVYDLAQNKVPGQGPQRVGLLARRRRSRHVLRCKYGSDLGSIRASRSTTRSGPSSPRQTTRARARQVHLQTTAPTSASARPPTRSSPRAASSRAAACTAACSAPTCAVNSYSEVTDSLLFEGVNVGRHARIRKTIIDKNVDIPPGTTIGFDPVEDRRRFFVSPAGTVVVPKGTRL